jgi:hypothetical protein
MKRKKRKNTKTYWANIGKKLQRQMVNPSGVARVIQLHNRMNDLTLAMNLALKDNFAIENFKPLGIGKVIKQAQWHKDQELARIFAIQGSRSFCCPISGEILDCRDSVLIGGEIFSMTGLYTKHGAAIIGRITT